MGSLEPRIEQLEKAISQACERVGELQAENRRLKNRLRELEHGLADKSRKLALIGQAEEKFLELETQSARLLDERARLKSEVEQLLRKVASLKAALLQLD